MDKLIKEQVGFRVNSLAVVPKGGEVIPAGRFMGGEEVPPGGWCGGEEVPPGGWCYIKTDTYRTKDGSAYFKFGFEQVGSHIEIDILEMPTYNGRDENIHTTHRKTSSRGGYRVCVGEDCNVKDMYSAKKWAAIWSEHTWKYITTGKQFPNS